ncbi:hypothetical protein [Parapedobacter indicus]|uniref:Lipoprotein n=1 Tax=Parapedobacter indicus TaxID=1477437 RepID=A0A1I3UY98_9SPHI|nr:hypothetical protein [Parapedobacter indicus]PPK99046.1 hypothetical protein CLV26_11577 [Parapedobacter indicus]SFJ87713.1 hypothetical protein SAMN05444682_115101 [Parapedobacter indicus]
MLRLLFSAAVSLLFFVSCKKEEGNDQPTTIHSDFSDGKDGWQAGFSEYNGDNVESYELEEGIAILPSPLDETKTAYRISGMNRSDDLFMYLTKRVQGLQPGVTYHGRFTVRIASDAKSGGVGAGGAPGESVGLGVGLTVDQPTSSPDENNFYRMNIDKIQQCCTDGDDMVVIGNVANGKDEYEYTLIERTGEFSAVTDHQGVLWIIIGTDSGYEGKTTLYYSNIEVILEKT